MLCACTAGCADKPKPQGTVIGGADGVTEIVVAGDDGQPDRDTQAYEIPQCSLWYTEELPEAERGKGIRMWTEHKEYGEGVQAVNVFVANPTDLPIDFGRRWELYAWNGKEWTWPGVKVSYIAWEDDLFVQHRGRLLYCFRFPVGTYYLLPEGTYRLSKTFRADGKEMTLTADFNVRDTDAVPARPPGANEDGSLGSQ